MRDDEWHSPQSTGSIREATLNVTMEVVDLAVALTGGGEKDYHYFINNQQGIWRALVLEEDGKITGFLSLGDYPTNHMLELDACRKQQN